MRFSLVVFTAVYSLLTGFDFVAAQQPTTPELLPPIVQGQQLDSNIVNQPVEYEFFSAPSTVNFQPRNQTGWHAPVQGLSGESCFDSVCAAPSRGLVWFAAIETTFLHPKMDRPNAFAIFQDFEQTKLIQTEAETRNLDAFYAAPRIVIGAKRNQHDFVCRYWQLDFANSKFLDSHDFNQMGQPNQTATAFDTIDVDMSTIDLEIHRAIGRSNAKLIFGTRYVDVKTAAYAQVTDSFVRNVLGSINRFNEQNYEGLGFVAGLKGKRPLRGNWNLTWSGRASGIFGTYYNHRSLFGAFNGDYSLAEATIQNSTTTTRTLTRNPTPNYNVQARANAVAPDRTSLWIFEGQLGLARSYELQFIPATAHFGFGFEYQFWAMPDGQIDTALALGNRLPAPLVSDPSIDLTGFNISAGISY